MRPGVDLLVHQVVQLEHVHHAHGDVLVERLAGAAVEEHHLARCAAARPRRTASWISVFARAVEHRRGDVDALACSCWQSSMTSFVRQRVEEVAERLVVVDAS